MTDTSGLVSAPLHPGAGGVRRSAPPTAAGGGEPVPGVRADTPSRRPDPIGVPS